MHHHLRGIACQGRAARPTRRFGIVVVGVVALVATNLSTLPAGAQVVSAWNVALTRAPYLTDLVASHVNVNWATNRSATTGTLKWGTLTGGTCALTKTQTATRVSITVGSVAEYQWKAGLTLPAQGTYCYRPFLAATDLLGSDVAPRFQSQVPAGDPSTYSFDVFGDWGQVDSSGNSADQSNLFAQVAASGARFAVTVGDSGYPNGSQLNYGDLQQKGADTSAIFGPTFWTAAGTTIPMFNAVGNHGLSGPTHTDISTWTQDQAVSASGGRYQNDTYCCVNGSVSSSYASEWYAFDAGPARFYVLDSAWGDANGGTASPYANDAAAHFAPGTPEYQWLLNDLQTHPTTLKFAFSHYPMYSDNPNEKSDTFLQGVNGLEGMLGFYGVNIEFNGHAHLYERNKPSGPGMPITYITGGGGASLEPIGPCHLYDAYGIGWSPTNLRGSACGAASAPASASRVFHFLKVTVAGNTVTVAPTDKNGNTFDVQTYTFDSVPDTVIDTGPTSLTNSSGATFTFRSTRSGAAFGCSLDGAPATDCASPVNYSSLGEGQHSFSVAATTPGGTDSTPAGSQWSIDTVAPTRPTGLTGSATAAAVNLSWTASSDANGIGGYDLLRDGTKIGPAPPSATTYTDTTTAPSSSYTYTVVARDVAGNTSVASAPATVTTPAGSGAAPVLVQRAASATTTVTLPGASAPGDLLVLTAGAYTGASKLISAVTDDAGNKWVKVGAYFVSGQNSDGEMWYSANAAAATRITATTSATVALNVQEFRGVAAASPLDTSAGAAGTSKAASSGAATPTSGNDLAVGFVAGHTNAQSMSVSSAGYTMGAQQTTTSPSVTSVRSGWQALGSASSQSFVAGFTSTMYWSAGVALFRAASSGPPPSDDFSVSASPSSLTVTAGQSVTSTISTATTGGSPQTVALSGSGAPAGVSVDFAPASVTSGQASTMTVTTTSAATAGDATIVVTGTGSATHSVSVPLTVQTAAAPDFSMSASPSSLTVTAGQSVTSTISTATTGGSPQTVALSGSGAPAGVSVDFAPASVTSGQASTMTVTTTSAATAGDATIVVTGTGSATHSVSVSLTVTSGGSNTAPSLVQSASSTATAPSTAPATTLTKPTSAGDLLVLSVSLYAGTTNHITSITDSAGNTWVRVNAWSTASHNSDGEMWYAADVAATSGLTVTAHVVTAASMAFEVDEFSGIATTSPLDQSAGASTTGTTASSGPLTPAASGALLIGFSAGHASTQTMAVSASGFTAQPQRISTGPVVTLVTGFRVLAAPEATSFSASFAAAMYWAAGLAVFRPAP